MVDHNQFCGAVKNCTEKIMKKLVHDSGLTCSHLPISQLEAP